MPRRRMMDYNMMEDGRNPYGSRGGYVSSRRMRRMRDRGMDYGHYGIRGGEHYSMESDYPHSQYNDERNRRDYESSRQSHMDYGHSPMKEGKTYYPIEAMGTFNGYWGTPQQDYARGDYNYDMRGRYDMGYDYRGGRDYAGDMGENLTKEELEHWRKKLDREVGDEQAKNFFRKENIEQKARAMGIEMKHFNADELALASYMLYSDYCKSMKPYVGSNMDVFIKMGEEFLTDPDSAVKGGEKLALYHEIVSGEDD